MTKLHATSHVDVDLASLSGLPRLAKAQRQSTRSSKNVFEEPGQVVPRPSSRETNVFGLFVFFSLLCASAPSSSSTAHPARSLASTRPGTAAAGQDEPNAGGASRGHKESQDGRREQGRGFGRREGGGQERGDREGEKGGAQVGGKAGLDDELLQESLIDLVWLGLVRVDSDWFGSVLSGSFRFVLVGLRRFSWRVETPISSWNALLCSRAVFAYQRLKRSLWVVFLEHRSRLFGCCPRPSTSRAMGSKHQSSVEPRSLSIQRTSSLVVESPKPLLASRSLR